MEPYSCDSNKPEMTQEHCTYNIIQLEGGSKVTGKIKCYTCGACHYHQGGHHQQQHHHQGARHHHQDLSPKKRARPNPQRVFIFNQL